MSLDIFGALAGIDIFALTIGTETQTISSDAIAVSSTADIVIIQVSAAGATDDLKTITPVRANQIYILWPATSKTITLNTTGNIKLPASNFTLTGNRIWACLSDGTNVKELTSAENA